MRVTDRMIAYNATGHMQDALSNLNETTETNATGKQFRYASDNVPNAVESLNLRSTIEMNDAYIETANTTGLWMTATNSAIGSMITLATKAKNLAIQAQSDTMGEDQRTAIAAEVDLILNQAVSAGNTKHLGHYLFSGFQTNTQPFTLDPNTTPPPNEVVTYHGDTGDIYRNIGPEIPIKVNADGTIFNQTGTDVFASMIAIKEALTAATYNKTDLEAGITQIDAAITYINNQNSIVAGRHKELEDAINRMEKTKIDLKSLLSKKEDIDEAEGATNQAQATLVYQKVLSVAGDAIKTMSLFDYL